MGLLDDIFGRRRRETTANVATQNVPQQQPPGPIQGAPSQFDSKFIDGVNQRITSTENEISKINTALDGAKRSISDIRTELDVIKENVKMVVSLYEMVSKKFNPFMDTTPEEIKEITDALREEIREVELLVRSAINDLRELYGTPDVESLVSDIEPEGDEDDQ